MLSGVELLAGGALALWLLNGNEKSDGLLPIPERDSYSWETTDEVGTNSDGVTFAVQGLVITQDDGEVIQPNPDRSLWRAVQISSDGTVSPFAGQNSFGGLDGSGWGVVKSEAMSAAQSRLQSSEGTGDIDPTPDPTPPPLNPTPQFPDYGGGSFEGFNLGGGVI